MSTSSPPREGLCQVSSAFLNGWATKPRTEENNAGSNEKHKDMMVAEERYQPCGSSQHHDLDTFDTKGGLRCNPAVNLRFAIVRWD